MKLTLENLSSVRIWTPADVRPAAEAFLVAVSSTTLDVRIGACHNIATGRPMVDADGNILATDVFGWTDDQSDRWWCMPHFALDSPVPTACRYESEPFWGNAEGLHTSRLNPFLKNLNLNNFNQRALIHAAIVAPVHLPFGQIGAVSITPRDRAQSDLSAEFDTYAAIFGLYARTFIAGYVGVMGRPQRLPVQPNLHTREIECLRWAAIGKTDDTISELMSLSRSTVRFHITNAMNKLDAVNRGQAVLKAAQLGYIKLQ